MAAELDDERELSTLTRLACGGIAGTTGQTVAYPLDVVRRRMQVNVKQDLQLLSNSPSHDTQLDDSFSRYWLNSVEVLEGTAAWAECNHAAIGQPVATM